jgi:hypothetical protein
MDHQGLWKIKKLKTHHVFSLKVSPISKAFVVLNFKMGN